MPEENRPLRCVAHPGCQYPNCYCQVDPPPANQFKEKVNLVARELQRASVALSQFKDDLKDVELENTILISGIQDLIKKFTYEGIRTDNITLRLLYCNIIKDLESVVAVSQQTAADIYSKTQTSNS